ncbi:acetyl-CoA carboxylase, biotin carboxyl carrier protein [Sphingomonas sp. MM-1]|uniref:acetyl-CoA carboxylase biotin carboxyl carrier protein n=1 Tax=Sphingomonas sp. MM-1 TaxID=745310 RepID=UPI0002C075B6|nr:acetyl-CoA carboxylase biotin carboxyl carrier protein [Sphingomonas sp. MM-1]AGH51306.1 acetyl-CoA carboxylase, biotin carboxyl carrier protein [Sphingomonas sp. MM-1]
MTEKHEGPIRVDVDLVKQLAELLDATKLTEIEVEDGDRRIRVARKAASPAPMAYAAAPAPAAGAPAATLPAAPIVEAAPADHPGAVKSPMVGTVYLAPEPGAPTFVSPGDKVAAGQTLLIVEAMKVMNPITASRGGVVRDVLVENGQPVEFDQPLLIIE